MLNLLLALTILKFCYKFWKCFYWVPFYSSFSYLYLTPWWTKRVEKNCYPKSLKKIPQTFLKTFKKKINLSRVLRSDPERRRLFEWKCKSQRNKRPSRRSSPGRYRGWKAEEAEAEKKQGASKRVASCPEELERLVVIRPSRDAPPSALVGRSAGAADPVADSERAPCHRGPGPPSSGFRWDFLFFIRNGKSYLLSRLILN